jgi:hypothetical protein
MFFSLFELTLRHNGARPDERESERERDNIIMIFPSQKVVSTFGYFGVKENIRGMSHLRQSLSFLPFFLTDFPLPI